jgi:NAD(P)-dependent dehydrogenase (short-subunit alcohol dehydrogenase family)
MAKALIIGASSGIGAALQQQLQDWELITLSRSTNPALDVTQEEGWPSIEGPLDALVYMPGSIRLKPFERIKAKEFAEDFDLNVLGAVRTLQAYGPNLKLAEQSSVVLMSTVAVGQGMPFHASVAAAKGAVEGLVRSLAAEWAPRVRVNAVAPSLTNTPLAARLLRNDAQKEAGAKRHPLERVGEADDLASAVRFLISSESSWISGQVLGVDGGLSTLRK